MRGKGAFSSNRKRFSSVCTMRRDGVNQGMRFRDRTEAGEYLGRKLERYRNASDTVLFALPNGGVVIAHAMTQTLHLPIDLIVTKKIGHPVLPEYAIAVVSEDDALVSNKRELEMVNSVWFTYEVYVEAEEARRRRDVYMKGGRRHTYAYADMTAIIVDDGAATELTLQVAIQSIRKHNPRRIIVAVPVISASISIDIRRQIDDLIVLSVRETVFLVETCYEHFEQLSDKDVCDMLASDHFYDTTYPPRTARELLPSV